MSNWHDVISEHYLANSASFTQCLKQLSDDRVVMQLLQEGWGLTLPHECEYLKVDPQQRFWVRNTFWTFASEEWLLARAVIPYQTLAQDEVLLTHIGNQPIGELIYRDPAAKRQRIEVAPVSQTPYYHYFDTLVGARLQQPLQQQQVRRSILDFQQQPILIIEVILHELDKRLSDFDAV